MTDNRPDDRSHRRDESDRSIPTDRESPVGSPVIRGDESVAGTRAREAVQFDPDDPESLADAAETVRRFAGGETNDDHLYMLRGAAACAALVRGEGSYKKPPNAPAATLPSPLSASGLASTISRARSANRSHSVRSPRQPPNTSPASAANHGSSSSRGLPSTETSPSATSAASPARSTMVPPSIRPSTNTILPLGRLELTLSPVTYRALRRRASIDDVNPGELVTEALEQYFE